MCLCVDVYGSNKKFCRVAMCGWCSSRMMRISDRKDASCRSDFSIKVVLITCHWFVEREPIQATVQASSNLIWYYSYIVGINHDNRSQIKCSISFHATTRWSLLSLPWHLIANAMIMAENNPSMSCCAFTAYSCWVFSRMHLSGMLSHHSAGRISSLYQPRLWINIIYVYMFYSY